MVANHYGKHYTLDTLRGLCQFSRSGVSLLGISEAAEQIGLRSRGVMVGLAQLKHEIEQPCILHWQQQHFVVWHPGRRNGKARIYDPAKGIYDPSDTLLLSEWAQSHLDGKPAGVALLLEPSPAFWHHQSDPKQGFGWAMLGQYVWQQKRLLLQVFIALLVASMLQLIMPLLTQSVVDTGIAQGNLHFIQLVLMAQLALMVGRTAIEFIRSRLLLYISTRINVQILSDFWMKLTRLPMSFFDTKMTGDIMQRLSDHHRIQQFLTGTLISTAFSLVNLVLYAGILLLYNGFVFGVYLAGTILYYVWIRLFLALRQSLDRERFSLSSQANSKTMQLVQGMQEIKLSGTERIRRWDWEAVQAALFRLQFRALSINQAQQAGALVINEGKNIVMSFMVAQAVVNGQLTLGAMLAIQYIIGSINGPIEQLIGFVQQAQDARLSLDRLNEIHSLPDEADVMKNGGNSLGREQQIAASASMATHAALPVIQSLWLQQLSFAYPGTGNEAVLKQIDLHIPEGKTTALVGASGSGKTTLLKLLLGYYATFSGNILIGNPALTTSEWENMQHQNPEANAAVSLRSIDMGHWRSRIGVVMQDGYIFNDTIEANITQGRKATHEQHLQFACHVANLTGWIASLPLGYATKIGNEGMGISQGQKQRILMARAVYKNPQYLFLDEATNALDANNEKAIVKRLADFTAEGPEGGKPRTVVIVAHRLSTVTHADKIVVLHKGAIAEEGTHSQLTQKRGLYYELVKNQLELGS
jgi:ATP-binding cassette subfamily B protein